MQTGNNHSSALLYAPSGTLPGRNGKAAIQHGKVLVLDSGSCLVAVGDKVTSLRHVQNLREEEADGARRGVALQLAAGKGGRPISKSALGKAIYAADWGPVVGQPTLDVLMSSLCALLDREFEISPLVLANGRSWKWDAQNLELRRGMIRDGKIIAVEP